MKRAFVPTSTWHSFRLNLATMREPPSCVASITGICSGVSEACTEEWLHVNIDKWGALLGAYHLKPQRLVTTRSDLFMSWKLNSAILTTQYISKIWHHYIKFMHNKDSLMQKSPANFLETTLTREGQQWIYIKFLFYKIYAKIRESSAN